MIRYVIMKINGYFNKVKNKIIQILINIFNIIKDKIEQVKYFILDIILRCLMK